MSDIIYINSLESARKKLSKVSSRVTVSNDLGTTWYLGAKVIDRIFKILQQEFEIEVAFNAEDNNAAVFAAIKLGYKNIIYTGDSPAIIKILKLEVV